MLTIIKESKEPISRDEIASLMKVSNRIVNDYLESLYKREYIMDSRGDWRDNETKEKTFQAKESKWIISAEGLNYLDLHRYWWTRFWTRSILWPLIVSAATSIFTAINAEKVRKLAETITSLLLN